MTTDMTAAPKALDLALLKAIGLDRAAPEQRELAIHIADRYGLDLMLKHLVLIDGKPYVTRDALLHIAHRSGQFDGISTTTPEVVGDEWRCSATVWRRDMTHPFTYGGRYPVKGRNANFAPEMAIKVAESMALRRAFNVAAPVVEERWDVDLSVAESEPRQTLAERAKAAEVVPLDRMRTYPPESVVVTDRPDGIVNADEVAEGAPAVYSQPPEATPTVSAGLSVEAFKNLCVQGGKSTVAIAKAIECGPDLVGARVKAMSPVERGVLADELGIDWRAA